MAVFCSDLSVTISSPSRRCLSWSQGSASENTANTSGKTSGCRTSSPIPAIDSQTLKLIEMFCLEICQGVSVVLHAESRSGSREDQVVVLRNRDSLANKEDVLGLG